MGIGKTYFLRRKQDTGTGGLKLDDLYGPSNPNHSNILWHGSEKYNTTLHFEEPLGVKENESKWSVSMVTDKWRLSAENKTTSGVAPEQLLWAH